jgi:hypothetical protein
VILKLFVAVVVITMYSWCDSNTLNVIAIDMLQSFKMFIVTVIKIDEDWYLGYHPAWTQKAQVGVCYDSAHHPEDFRGPWCALQDVDNYIYKNICKIVK